MLRSKGQPKRNVGPSTWPPKHTGSSDEYETDEHDPSEVDSSDEEEGGNDGGAMARGARASGQRSGGSGPRSGGRTGGSMRNGSRSGGKKGSGSGRKKGSVDLLDSDDSDVEVHRPLSQRASKKNTKKSADSSDYDTDEDEVVSSRKGGVGGRSQRKALGRINGDRRGQRSSVNDSDDDASIDSDSSEDSDALFRPKGRAPRRKAPLRKGKGSDSDSDSSDSSDSDIGMHLGRNREKELAAKRQRLLGRGVAAGCSSSDESDSASDGEIKKKKPARKGATLARSARAAQSKKSSTMDDSSGSDDDSSVAFLGTSPRRNPKRGAASPQKRRAAKRPDARRTPPRAAAAANKRSSIDQSFVESDDEGLPPMAEVPSLPRTQAAAPARATTGSAVPHDPSVRAASNAAIEKAKAAREALRAAQRYEAKEAELPAMELELPSTKRRPPVEEIVLDLDDTAGVSRAVAPPSYTGRLIRVALRYQHPQTKKDAKANVKIRTDQPLQHLVDEFRSQNGSLEVASMKFDGLNMDLSKTPTFYDMDDEDLVDTVVKERRGPGSRVFNVTSSPTKIQAASLGRPVRLKFRANGKASEVETISVRLKETFQSAMARFAEKRNVSLAACKFIFDGEVLRPTQTPLGLDLEGDEIIDVKVPESGAPAGQAGGGGAASARASRGGSRSLAPVAKISFQTNRNQNNATRQKTWKVSNADPFSTLKADYMKYYKSKGCKRVLFYFRNAPIAENETRPFRNLGICDGDMLYAMENGKTYRPV